MGRCIFLNGLGRSLNHEPDAHQCARGVLASSEGERQVPEPANLVIRGGSFNAAVSAARAAYRYFGTPTYSDARRR